MAATSTKKGAGGQLTEHFETLVNSITETLSSLVGGEIKVRRGRLTTCDPKGLPGSLNRHVAIARGVMDKNFEGESMWTAFELVDAITMSGMLMMTPEEVVNARRYNDTLEEGEETATFSELGNVLYSGFSNVLRRAIHEVDVRMHDHEVIAPGSLKTNSLGDKELVTYSFRMKVGEYPESKGFLAITREVAEQWNKGPIEPPSVADAPAPTPALSSTQRLDDELLASIPAAPIRGTLAAYLVQGDAFRTLRRSCRRIGLDLHRHGPGEIPNPAAHRNEIVVLEVPTTEERRFEWCRRIKELSDSTPVLLLLRHPSRQRVTQAFLSKADSILGFPCDEQQLSEKLDSLAQPAPVAAADDACEEKPGGETAPAADSAKDADSSKQPDGPAAD